VSEEHDDQPRPAYLLWTDAVAVLTESWNVFAQAHPELAQTEVSPGAEAWITVDAGDLGRLRAVLAVPLPLEPNLGNITVMFRDTQAATVDMPFILADTAWDIEEAQIVTTVRRITVAQAVETSTVQAITKV
jgi:hypothetical protein